jgi:hypothetical protein
MRWICLAAALWMAGAASAQDARLAALHATLVTLRPRVSAATLAGLGARPELTVAKHQLRDWIETQLGSLTGTQADIEQEKALAERINAQLKAVSVTDAGDDQNLLGSLGEVRFSSESGLLIITTGVGIPCQYDESAYGYRRVDGSWQRIWETEQDDYSPEKYAPQLTAGSTIASLSDIS